MTIWWLLYVWHSVTLPPLEKSCPRPCSHNYKIPVTPLSYRFFLFLSLPCIPNIFIFCVFGELTVFLYFSGFLTAVLQTHARQRNLPVDSLSFCYQVLNDKWTNDELVHSESDVDFKRVAFQVRYIRGATCTEYSWGYFFYTCLDSKSGGASPGAINGSIWNFCRLMNGISWNCYWKAVRSNGRILQGISHRLKVRTTLFRELCNTISK